jgi:hypothetical protein
MFSGVKWDKRNIMIHGEKRMILEEDFLACYPDM